MKSKLISLKQVVNRLKQNPLMRDVQWEFCIERTAELLQIIGAPSIYVKKVEDIEIKQFRGILPVDFIGDVKGVMKVQNNGLVPMLPDEGILSEHYAGFRKAAPENKEMALRYSLSHSAIFTDFEEGQIVFAYETLATDEECYPLIPGNAALARAIESYIKYKWYDIQNDLDIVSDRKLNKAEAEYAYNIGQAEASLKMPTIDEMEVFTNEITQLIPSKTAHQDRFAFLGTQEFMKLQ